MPPEFLNDISHAFNRRIGKYHDTAQGVLWKNADGQLLRFELLAGILDDAPTPGTASGAVSVNDLGCGYGALLDFLGTLPGMPDFDYAGYDIAENMIATARARDTKGLGKFSVAQVPNRIADYSFVSGTYNLKIGVEDDLWRDFVRNSLAELWSRTDVAMAFNMLDARAPKHLDGLYYGDADDLMDFARSLSPNVTLIDDYPLDEGTIYLRR